MPVPGNVVVDSGPGRLAPGIETLVAAPVIRPPAPVPNRGSSGGTQPAGGSLAGPGVVPALLIPAPGAATASAGSPGATGSPSTVTALAVAGPAVALVGTSLPFTGWDPLGLVAFGLLLLFAGMVLRRRASARGRPAS